jgi:pimeloyl-ACP methyl ester carboxylesterase
MPVHMKRIELSQGTIQYREVGAGLVVLFVHGLLINGELWSGVAEKLSPTHRCIVPDWPLDSHRIPMTAGADQTPAGVAHQIADFLTALDLRDVALVGYDTGGVIALLVAADHGEPLARLVLTNCDGLEAFPPKWIGHLGLLARIPGLVQSRISRCKALEVEVACSYHDE